MFDLDAVPFIPGLELSRCFYDEVVRPLLQERYPQLTYAAGRLEAGSDVLGFDTLLSRDHDWGPKLTLLLDEQDYSILGHALDDYFRRELPLDFLGYPTNFEQHEDGSLVMAPVKAPPVNHHIKITTPAKFFLEYLAYDISEPLPAVKWLTFPEQRLRTIRSGLLFRDDGGRLTAIRQKLDYYPHDLWLYLMAVAWRRIDQEEPFVGRTGHAGDELGSRLVAARQVYNIVRLCFLMERQYAPYSKWLGTAFNRLECANAFHPLFELVWTSQKWEGRQEALTAVYEELARRHNALNLTPPLPARVSRFYDRPFQVIHSGRFVDALRAAIEDPQVKALPDHLGGIDQFVDSTDILSYPEKFGLFQDLIAKL